MQIILQIILRLIGVSIRLKFIGIRVLVGPLLVTPIGVILCVRNG